MMNTTDDEITPDRLRLAGWDDNGYGQYWHKGTSRYYVWYEVEYRFYRWVDTAMMANATMLAGMADVAARLAATQEAGP